MTERESWLEPDETRGWGCGACGQTAFGAPTATCGQCDALIGVDPAIEVAYRVALKTCTNDWCWRTHQHIDGHRVDVRIG